MKVSIILLAGLALVAASQYHYNMGKFFYQKFSVKKVIEM